MILALSVAAAGDCVGCHAAQHEAHATTRHARAFDNPSFQAAWSRWPDPWCTSCHAPDGGVGCGGCHLDGDTVLTARAPTELGLSVHEMRASPDLGTASCLPCHQFSPPGAREPLQATGAEHAAWRGDQTCADCHLAGHALRGARDVAFVREHVTAEVRAAPPGLALEIRARGIGHRFPTGDPWRRLRVEVGRDEEVLASWVLGRRVSGEGGGFHQVADLRLPPPDERGEARIVVDLGSQAIRWWRVTYLLTDPSHAELDEAAARVEVAAGRLR